MLIRNNINRTLSLKRDFIKIFNFQSKLYCPINLYFNDSLIKNQNCLFSILYKMEDNFEAKLKNIGNFILTYRTQ